MLVTGVNFHIAPVNVHCPRLTMAIEAKNEFSKCFVGAVVVDALLVNTQPITVLFNLTTLLAVAGHGAFVGALFQIAV